ncbi:DUF2283 domain-containing protein [Dehalococcoidia bacterium]|nr:DUF2283 domain-containing protein [Dehalococcoidia bacterium]
MKITRQKVAQKLIDYLSHRIREVGKNMKQELKPFYDEENDILYLAREGEESEFVEIQPGVALEFDETRQIIGIEIMQASLQPLHLSSYREIMIR